MYGYNEIRSLSPEEILNEVSQEDIFNIFIKKEIIADKSGATYVAPYRNDENPDCYFEEYDGKLFFVDFADIPQSKNCFGFISKCTGLNYFDSLQYIVKHFDLGKGNSPKRNKTIQKENEVVEVKKIKRERTITYVPRQFNGKDKKFWSQYEISSKELIEDKVIPIDLYKSTSRKGEPFVIKPFDIMYAYTDFDNSKVKVYRPYGGKEEKWFTNCTQNDIGSINHLPISGDKLIISKSYKDCRVIRNQGLNSIWFQNEGMFPEDSLLIPLINNFDMISLFYDNDKTGYESSKKLKEKITNLSSITVNNISLPEESKVKDAGEAIHKIGENFLNNFLNGNNT